MKKWIKILNFSAALLLVSCNNTIEPTKEKVVGFNSKVVLENSFKNKASFQIKDDLKNDITVVSYTITKASNTESFEEFIKKTTEDENYQVDVYFIQALVGKLEHEEFYDYYCYGIVQYDQSNLQDIKYDVSFIEPDELGE